ncbi:Hypothetical predicted protein [Lecanosticta acicola]|uniref:Uncharacterized protein n=1 Tax=Lecanosticta acicola TaxID=111012 RepID=A0AAI9E942_9PEZI|nr:Hypothetical predicted protein [Lecanosticta acicola]
MRSRGGDLHGAADDAATSLFVSDTAHDMEMQHSSRGRARLAAARKRLRAENQSRYYRVPENLFFYLPLNHPRRHIPAYHDCRSGQRAFARDYHRRGLCWPGELSPSSPSQTEDSTEQAHQTSSDDIDMPLSDLEYAMTHSHPDQLSEMIQESIRLHRLQHVSMATTESGTPPLPIRIAHQDDTLQSLPLDYLDAIHQAVARRLQSSDGQDMETRKAVLDPRKLLWKISISKMIEKASGLSSVDYKEKLEEAGLWKFTQNPETLPARLDPRDEDLAMRWRDKLRNLIGTLEKDVLLWKLEITASNVDRKVLLFNRSVRARLDQWSEAQDFVDANSTSDITLVISLRVKNDDTEYEDWNDYEYQGDLDDGDRNAKKAKSTPAKTAQKHSRSESPADSEPPMKKSAIKTTD